MRTVASSSRSDSVISPGGSVWPGSASLPSIASAAFFRMLVSAWPTWRRSQISGTGWSGSVET